VVAAPFGFTVAFNLAEMLVISVADTVVALGGAGGVVNDKIEPYDVPEVFVMTALK
jgi:hypothetical protein